MFVFGHLMSRLVLLAQDIGGQLISSVLLPSLQSMMPLQRLTMGMHLKFLH
jgi:hypothetical protein